MLVVLRQLWTVSDVACLQEMTVLFSCLKNSEFNQTVCAKEISNFQGCYTDYVVRILFFAIVFSFNARNFQNSKQADLKNSTASIGSKNLTPKQVNALLKKFSA